LPGMRELLQELFSALQDAGYQADRASVENAGE
jgi:hypothetical protein